MVKVYGASDDLVEIEGSSFSDNEIDCIDADVRISFDDGTIIRIGYPKVIGAIWWIEVERQGSAESKLTVCEDENAEIYSDIFEIDAEVDGYSVIEQKHCYF